MLPHGFTDLLGVVRHCEIVPAAGGMLSHGCAMSVCRYCGQSAGWFRDMHDVCEKKAQQGIQSLKMCVTDAVMQGKTFAEVKEHIDRLVSDSAIPNDQVLLAIK